MFLLLGPLLLILVCVGYRVFVRTKQAQAKKYVDDKRFVIARYVCGSYASRSISLRRRQTNKMIYLFLFCFFPRADARLSRSRETEASCYCRHDRPRTTARMIVRQSRRNITREKPKSTELHESTIFSSFLNRLYFIRIMCVFYFFVTFI